MRRRPHAAGGPASSTTWASPSGSAEFHRFDGLRAIAHGITLELAVARASRSSRRYGYVVRRRDLDQMVAEQRREGRARRCWQGAEATAPVIDRGLVARRGRQGQGGGPRRCAPATSSSPTARTPASAGRSARPATARTRRAWPSAATSRARCTPSPWIESALDVHDRNGNSLPGYGWIFPVGDGTVNVGVGLLSTFRDFKSVNTTHLLDEYAATAPAYWEIVRRARGRRAHRRPAADGRLGRPQGRPDVGRRRRRRRIDQPVQRRGHRLRLRDRPHRRATCCTRRCRPATASRCSSYPKLLEAEYGLYFKVARLFAQIIGQPGADARAHARRHAAAAR